VSHIYCDDLFDYWPDVQHPVGYHPSTACSADASRTRGFDAASQVFGSAHLACDAHAYAAPGHRLNPYYMQSRWDAQAHEDLAMPTPAEAKTVHEMPTLGVPSYADTDTTLRGQEHTAERLMQHSVGLVRAWAQPRREETTARASGAATTTRSASPSAAPSGASSTSTRTRTRAAGCACARTAATSTRTAPRTSCAPANVIELRKTFCTMNFFLRKSNEEICTMNFFIASFDRVKVSPSAPKSERKTPQRVRQMYMSPRICPDSTMYRR
jgi:hypothetical protein